MHQINKRSFSVVVLVLLPLVGSLLLFSSSCEDSVPSGSTPDVVFPDSGVSYSRHVEAVFANACAFAGCHAGSSPANGLNLERPSYRALMDHFPQLVIQRDGENSLLVMYLDGRASPPMPPRDRPQLTQNQILGIRRWVTEGGLNN